jgi:UPF0716 protein FxsA
VNKSKLVAVAFAAWLVVEIVAFVLVVQFLGLLAAILLGVGTTLLGLADVKRLFVYLRSRLGKAKSSQKPGGMLDGGLQALSSLLLILPGFASDLIGLALKAPSIRAGLAKRMRDGPGARKGPPMIDLAANEWKNLKHDRPEQRGAAQ